MGGAHLLGQASRWALASRLGSGVLEPGKGPGSGPAEGSLGGEKLLLPGPRALAHLGSVPEVRGLELGPGSCASWLRCSPAPSRACASPHGVAPSHAGSGCVLSDVAGLVAPHSVCAA